MQVGKRLLQLMLPVPIIFFVSQKKFSITRIEGNSMNPTLEDKDIVLISKDLSVINRNDVLIFKSPLKEGEKICKRLIALPGDLVKPKYKDKKVLIPEGHCWIEGDGTGTDSNKFGVISIGLVDAVVLYKIYSENKNRTWNLPAFDFNRLMNGRLEIKESVVDLFSSEMMEALGYWKKR
ncbi:hypothetical protein HK099_003014 [Clydaea vesicula]|uniref:Mitochondrial inner membrane protease subunit n=1 Tax=Clydaea vesicula TaxID=447962 RepID=A0AAD5Y0H6_9FUNG|nr:hypothetical protein HK099_003014 [Clydaea vesicula]KAJ3386333.1 hypothetical protein HDU92_002596 [Lobulomyces angularis]